MVPELKLEQVRFRVYRGEALRATGETAVVTLRRDSTEITARDLVAFLREAEGGEPVRVTAARGEGVLATRRFQASGGVVVARGDDVARTASARYEPGDGGPGLVRGDEPVTVDGRGYQLSGPRFTLDPATGVIQIDGGTKLVAGTGATR